MTQSSMSEQDDEVFSGSVTSSPQMVNVPTSGPMYMVERSSAPQVIGILVIIYGILMVIGSLFGLVNLTLENVDGETIFPSWLIIGQTLTGVILSVVTAYAGFLMFSYKKRGIWISLGVIFAGWLINSIWTYLSTDYVLEASSETADLGGISEIMGGASAICGLMCALICGWIVAIPLFIANSGME